MTKEPQRYDLGTLPEDIQALRAGVISALNSLPLYFNFDNPVSGIDATDLFSLNTLMGAAIEVQVVETLNSLRSIWDPSGQWTEYAFVRSSQAFPDVRLSKRIAHGEHVALGIELKGWFLLSKEGVPSLRYQVSPEACNPWDLLCVVPWYLKNAVSGAPAVARPWVEQAKFAAEWRDYWWQHIRRSTGDERQRQLIAPKDPQPYPTKAELVSMQPVYDGGGNYGRLPRCKPLMDNFVTSTLENNILGIPARHWQLFLKLHSENADTDLVLQKVAHIVGADPEHTEARAERLRYLISELASDFNDS